METYKKGLRSHRNFAEGLLANFFAIDEELNGQRTFDRLIRHDVDS